jgi:tRNA (guanine-N7-)-methyltransferase
MRRGVRLPFEQLQPYLVPPDDAASPLPIDLGKLFGNNQPVEIEVGFGKGLFLVTTALARPAFNLLGVEIERKHVLFVANRLAKRAVPNVRLACADARTFLRDRLPAECAQALHVYYPDPWWKKRHHKRRLFTADFVRACERLLQPAGRLHLVTDVADYFAMAADLVAHQTCLEPVPVAAPGEPTHDLDYLTNFDRKFRKEGRPIHRACWRKPPPALEPTAPPPRA